MGIEDICSEAEIPYPKDRIEKIKNLNKNNVKSNSSKKSKNNEDSDIKLTKNQMFRINTISHLEKGKNQSKIIDNLLNIDSLIRNNNLDHDKIKDVSDYLSEAKNHGFDPHILLALQSLLNEAGFQKLTKAEREKLIGIASYLHSENMTALTFIQKYDKYIRLINIVNSYLSNKIGMSELSIMVNQL